MKIHSKKMNLTRGIDLKKVAEKMIGASGAESKVANSIKLYLNISIQRLCAPRPECTP